MESGEFCEMLHGNFWPSPMQVSSGDGWQNGPPIHALAISLNKYSKLEAQLLMCGT